jgi:methylmalonyl-CoA mutase cobalamin-binding domain/chain
MGKLRELETALAELDDGTFNQLLEEIMSEGPENAQLAVEACQRGMEEVGRLFEKGDYFVGDLIFAGEMLTDGMEVIKPALGESADDSKGKLILCTVKNDLHDIGKNIVKALLEAAGFEVVDLGIDTPPERIVQTAKEQNIRIIALSGVLTLAIDSMKATVDAFIEAGIRDEVRILIGGNPVTADARRITGADEWGITPQKAILVCSQWAQELMSQGRQCP